MKALGMMAAAMVATVAGATTWCSAAGRQSGSEPVKVGVYVPKAGALAGQGLDQLRGARLAVDEINRQGGVLGRRVELVEREAGSKAEGAAESLRAMVESQGVVMALGGGEGQAAVEMGRTAQELGVVFFPTLSHDPEVTGIGAQRMMFREGADTHAAAAAVAAHLNEEFAGKRYVYITSETAWGRGTEAAVRRFTATQDAQVHARIGVGADGGGATEDELRRAVAAAKAARPEVLVLALQGRELESGLRQATAQGVKLTSQVVAMHLTLASAESAGAKAMEGVIGASPWAWNVPQRFNFLRGTKFVEAFASRYGRYPCSSGASAYTVVHQWKAAAERAKSLEGGAVARELSGHRYTLLKDEQQWRGFDHQSVQTVYVVRGRPEAEVVKDRFRQDFFEVLRSTPGEKVFVGREEWNAQRTAAGKPTTLESGPAGTTTAGVEPGR